MSKTAKPQPTVFEELRPIRTECVLCGRLMHADYSNRRTVTTLAGVTRLTLSIRRCPHSDCAAFKSPYRPEAEGRVALPRHEFGLDVVALIGVLRYASHRAIPEIHKELASRGLTIAERTVTNLLDRYDELLATCLSSDARLQRVLARQGKAILAIDGLQPDVGHEVLWVIRDCLSGEVLLAKSLLSARHKDLAVLLGEVRQAVQVPILAVVSDGQHSIRKAVANALPGVPHQLCQFHYLREAARPIHEADRHAKKELKKQVRGVRGIERAVEERTDDEAEVIRGYCGAVRAALTDDNPPPLNANGLRLQDRLTKISNSLGQAAQKRGSRANCKSSAT